MSGRPPGAGGPVAVFGCGLVGASVAAALAGSGYEVWGADRRDLSPLVERGWLGRAVPVEELRDAAIVVLALPVAAVVGAVTRLAWRRGQLLTDTASVKGPILAAARHLPEGVRFVGGHPLAGGTGSGYEAARPDLFRGATWALAADDASAASREAVEALVRDLGAEPAWCTAERHDRLVAWTSHLPQLLATALAAELDAIDDPLLARFVGPGGRGFLRLGASAYPLWREILTANRVEVERALTAVAARASQPATALEEDFAAARRFLARLDES